MLTRPSTRVDVRVENSRVLIAGREYVKEHILVVGAPVLRLSITPERGVRVEAQFNEVPDIENVERDTVRVRGSRGETAVDMLGATIRNVKEVSGYIIVEAETLTVRFEVEGENVYVNIPSIGKIKVESLGIESNARSFLNMITIPFITGMVSATGGVRAKIWMRDSKVTIKIEEA